MSDVQDLIRHARELAAPLDEATPGPWEWRRLGLWSMDTKSSLLEPVSHTRIPAGLWIRTDADRMLIARAWVMARLLRQLADALEEAYTWMHNWHQHHCDEGRHAPNCPIADLRIEL